MEGFFTNHFFVQKARTPYLIYFLWGGEVVSREMKAGGVQENARGLTKIILGTHSRVHLMSLQREIKPWSPVVLDTLVDCALLDKKIYSTCLTSPCCGLLINSYYVTMLYTRIPFPILKVLGF